MKKLLYILPIFALFLASCEDFYLENQLEYETTIEDVRNFSYTLTTADYGAIAGNVTNKQIASALGETDSIALAQLGSLKYFTAQVAPDVYISAFLDTKYPQLSNGTICEVYYQEEDATPAYVPLFSRIRGYVPSTPLASVDSIVPFLTQKVPSGLRKDNYKYVVYYRTDSAFVYHWNGENFAEYVEPSLDIRVLTEVDYLSMGLDEMDIKYPEKYVPTYLILHYPYAQVGDKQGVIYSSQKLLTLTEYVFDGTNWTPRAKATEESMVFEVKDNKWKANTSVFLNEPFIDHGQGKFKVQDVLLQDPLTYVWYYDAKYGMCASAYKGGASYNSESWLVSPKVKLKKAKKPIFNFSQAFNKASNFTEECTVLISTDYRDDVKLATWEPLQWNKNEDGTLNVPSGTSWVFQSSGDFDLSKYVGQTIYIAFRYTTSGGISGTWELQNVLVHEKEITE